MNARIRSTLVLATLAAVAPALADDPHAHGEVHWSYQGHGGPAAWAKLNPEYATCGTGKHQSPIDIKTATHADLPEIQLAWQPGAFKVVNNGHTIQVTVPEGSSITVGDRKYELLQFHFHTPSEEAVKGKHAALVAHFVHKDAEGKLAVIGVLFDVGAENAGLAQVFAKMPAKAGEEATLDAPLDPSALVPAKRPYWEFEGSLTTPPCSEGVRWLVLQQRSTLSKAQLAAFQKLYPKNARPVQPLNGRAVRSSS